ncbi:HNH endonuclease signature motif containing protein [Spiroplasma endosymbiont of Cantharis nigra]|uniref:HNH endonuclease signature motif containing protein n=1 Tax=Spiroplasma endosymbiont of Cantharis nigra TaxID=3066278 RepID=UPI0030D492C3
MKTDLDICKSRNLKTLAVVMFNIVKEDKEFFYIGSNYKKSKHSKYKVEDFYLENNKLLVKETRLPFLLKNGRYIHEAKIKKTIYNNYDDFINILYKNILKERYKYSDNEYESIIFSSYFSLRGSIDISVKYISIDFFRKFETPNSFDKIFKLLTCISDLRQLNLNFRYLQSQYLKGKTRNDQIRVNLKYFYDNYLEDLEKLNKYKALLLKENGNLINSMNYVKKINIDIYKRKNFYINNYVANNNYFDFEDIQNQRQEIFGIEEKDSKGRNYSIVNYARNYLEDICFGCYNDFNIKVRSFKRKGSDSYYLEIHHVLAFANNEKFDHIDNLVKLCPTCHKALTPNRAEENLQKKIILSIINIADWTRKFIYEFLEDEVGEAELVNFIFEKLK